MIAEKKKFLAGGGMLVGFLVVMVIIFSPVFEGKNGLDHLDDLYNSISKGSAYYIPGMQKEASAFQGTQVSVELTFSSETQARQTALLLERGGARVGVASEKLTVAGDLGQILAVGLEDADRMYHNQGEAVATQYGYDARQVLYNWYSALMSMEKQLQKQKQFKQAKVVALIVKKAVECAYNFYSIEAKKISDSLGIVIFSLVFYVIYTLWYGYGILYLFAGWGMKLEH